MNIRAERSFWLPASQFAAFSSADTDAHRVFSGSEGWIERFANDTLVSYRNEGALEGMVASLAQWSAEAGWHPERVFARLLPRRNEDRNAPTLISGDPSLPLASNVRESGVRYRLDFGAGYSAGLFVDQRANRAWLHGAAPKRLLNTFAYTCSFSVVAALAGAETVSVDLSKASLARGRANFVLNGIDPGQGHRFLADDVLDLLPRLARRGEKFDAIVLDPPTFSRGNKGRRWRAEENLGDLLAAALDLAVPGGLILLSTNCTRLGARDLERMARFALKVARRHGTFFRTQQLPDFPPNHGASTLWLTV